MPIDSDIRIAKMNEIECKQYQQLNKEEEPISTLLEKENKTEEERCRLIRLQKNHRSHVAKFVKKVLARFAEQLEPYLSQMDSNGKPIWEAGVKDGYVVVWEKESVVFRF